MSRYTALVGVVILLFPLACFADDASTRAEHVESKHDRTIADATAVFWRAKTEADQQELEQIETIRRSIPTTDPAYESLKQKEISLLKIVKEDQASLKAGSPLIAKTSSKDSAIEDLKKKFPAATPDEVKAIADGKLIVGMTLDEANAAVGLDGDRTGGRVVQDAAKSSHNQEDYRWKIKRLQMHRRVSPDGALVGGSSVDVIAIFTATFEDGKIVSFTQPPVPPVGTEPAPRVGE